VSGSVLLLFASITAIIGAYHVFLALSRMRFFPEVLQRMSTRRGTPYVAILLAAGIPMLVLVAVRGSIEVLGNLYAFGLLGAFILTWDMATIPARMGHLDFAPDLISL
jgi:amino acid transporter